MHALGLILALLLTTTGLAAAAPPSERAKAASAVAAQSFETTEAAVDALVAAMRQERPDLLQAVLGPGSASLVNSGDRVADQQARRRFLEAYDARHALIEAAPDRMTLEVGDNHWPLPIPLVRSAGRWQFDSEAGAQELINRRIGRNEVAAISTALSYVDAQKRFFEQTGHYARRLVSTPGTHDGLYWPTAAGEPESPLSDLAERAEEEGYPIAPRRTQQLPYHGYLFRILTRQGPNSESGARDYLRGEQMTEGFGLIAWPVTFGVSGIMTFIVNQDGVIFQKNLGKATPTAAARITLFDPDLSWTRLDLTNP